MKISFITSDFCYARGVHQELPPPTGSQPGTAKISFPAFVFQLNALQVSMQIRISCLSSCLVSAVATGDTSNASSGLNLISTNCLLVLYVHCSGPIAI